MTIKSDSGRRWVEISVVLPGTPERIWKAFATGPGMNAWFTPATVEEHIGGALRFHFGGGVSTVGSVTSWQPPVRFAYEERDWSKGEVPPLATEIVITARSGDECVVRMVHSLFTTSARWDDELEGFERGWPGFFEILGMYLRHFNDEPAASARAMSVTPGTYADAWRSVSAALGLAGASLGDRRRAPDGAPPLAGVVQRVAQGGSACEIMLRLEEPGPGIALIGTHDFEGQARISMSLFFYGANAAELAKQAEPTWAAWLEETYPASARAS